MDRRYKCKAKSVKLIKRKKSRRLSSQTYSKGRFLREYARSINYKIKINKFDFIKMKNIYRFKGTFKNEKTSLRLGKILVT